MSTSKNRQKLVSLAVKLKRLSEDAGATAAEAQAALLRFQRIVVEHDITNRELELGGDTNPVMKEAAMKSKSITFWHGALANVIGDNFRVTSFWEGHETRDWHLTFLGRRDDVERAMFVFNAAKSVVEAMSERFTRDHEPTPENIELMTAMAGGVPTEAEVKKSWTIGFIGGLRTKFESQVAEYGWGLVLTQDPEVKKAAEDLDIQDQDQKPQRPEGSLAAMLDGYKYAYEFQQGQSRIDGGS